ncbi:MAG: hypothetical protein LBK18_02015 [Prevotellaceae bacterium]|jgi:hypothetical protein|nr:hypothetical protein [Prevotellaceae bacterium]
MKKQLMKICAVALCALPCAARAQESAEKKNDVNFSVGVDMVSSYVWRGAYQAGVSAQPSVGVELAGFSLSSWGSVDVDAGFKEVDFTLSYSIAGLDAAVTDYWWGGEGAYGYFSRGNSYDPADPDKKVSDHLFEATLAYTLPIEKLPLKLSWSTFFAGNDFKYDAAGKVSRAFSTYIEASYPFTVKDVALDVALGVRPWESPAYQPASTLESPAAPSYYSADFAVVNISLKATKELKITDSFTLPVFGRLIFNPNTEDVFLVCGITF